MKYKGQVEYTDKEGKRVTVIVTKRSPEGDVSLLAISQRSTVFR